MKPTQTETAVAGQRVPELLLERLALGELTASDAASVRDRLAEEPGGHERLRAIEADNQSILDRYPAERTLASVRARVNERARTGARGGWLRRWSPMLGAAAVAAIALLVAQPWADRSDTPRGGSYVDPYGPGDVTREKGPGEKRASLHIYRKNVGATDPQASASELLEPGEQVATNDTLQVGYVAAGKKHGVLLSIDGRGAVTLHSPATPTGDTALSGEGEVALPFAYQLDDAPNFERFFFVTSSETVSVRAILDAARLLAASADGGERGALVLPANHDVTTMLLEKSGEAP